MKKLFLVTLAAGTFLVMFSNCGGSVTPKSEMDSLAYAIGVDVATGIKQFDSTINVAVLNAAIRDVFNNKAKMENQTAGEFIREYMQVRKPAKALAEGEAYLNNIEKTNKNVRKTDSGLIYEIIEPGDMSEKPTNLQDKVKVMYEGQLKDGRVFDSSFERGDTVEFALNRVIRGWGEGLQLVGKGGKVKLYIPADLAYGPGGQPYGQVPIGPNEPLVFDVTLVDVEPFVPEEE